MKKALILILGLMSASAFACPNLAGNYICVDNDTFSGPSDPYEMTVIQQGNRFEVTDEDGTSTFTADGVLRDLDGVPTQISCNGNEVISNIAMSGPGWSLESTSKTFLNGRTLINESTAQYTHAGHTDNIYSITQCEPR